MLGKGVECVPHCLLCENHDETLGHVFCLFPSSIECWKHVELWEKIEPIMQSTSSMQQLFFALRGDLPKKSSRQFCYAYYVEYLKTKKQQALGQHYRNTSTS